MRKEVGGRTAAVLWDVAFGICCKQHLAFFVVPVYDFFSREFRKSPGGASVP